MRIEPGKGRPSELGAQSIDALQSIDERKQRGVEGGSSEGEDSQTSFSSCQLSWNWLMLVLEGLFLPAPEVSRSFEISPGRSIYTRQWAKATWQDTEFALFTIAHLFFWLLMAEYKRSECKGAWVMDSARGRER